jgi:hypothetical protein
MKINPFLVLFSISLIFGLGCTPEEDRIDIKAYYFPIDSLVSPMVYEYQPLGTDTISGPSYWYFRTLETDTATYFTTNIYNQFFEVEQFSTEEVVRNGTITKDYFLFTMDSTGRQERLPAEVEYNTAFPFEVKDSTGVFLQKLKFTFSESPIHTTTVIKNRRYMGAVKYDFNGQFYDAVKFKVRELIDDYAEGHLETETEGVEIYAKGIGLVYYKKTVGDKLSMEYRLFDRYTMEELENKFAATLEDE